MGAWAGLTGPQSTLRTGSVTSLAEDSASVREAGPSGYNFTALSSPLNSPSLLDFASRIFCCHSFSPKDPPPRHLSPSKSSSNCHLQEVFKGHSGSNLAFPESPMAWFLLLSLLCFEITHVLVSNAHLGVSLLRARTDEVIFVSPFDTVQRSVGI